MSSSAPVPITATRSRGTDWQGARRAPRPGVDRLAGALLVLLGILTVGTGLYLFAVRPAMLPEDVEFTGVKLEDLRPAMVEWLDIVFRTWGAFVTGFGVIVGGVGAHMFTSRAWLLRSAVAVGVLIAFGQFLASNVALRSDFLWFIGLLFVMAALSASYLWLGQHRRRSP
jgi:hypothetical protein